MVEKIRASRNRTLTVSEEEKEELQNEILYEKDIKKDTNFVNTTINGDLFDVIKFIPDNFAELIIIDPPYNLTKNFNGMTFSEMTAENYDQYLDSWFHEVCKKLKLPNILISEKDIRQTIKNGRQ